MAITTAKVVVGVNGSPAGAAAVRWAAAEAQRRRADLHVIAAYEWRVPGRRFPHRSDLLRTAEERAAVVLDAAVLQAQSAAPDARTHGTAVVGSPVPVLLGAAADAGLLVVGGRAVGATRPMLGPVTSQIATYAPGLLANCWNLSSAEVFRAAEATGLADDRAELGPTQSGLHTPARA